TCRYRDRNGRQPLGEQRIFRPRHQLACSLRVPGARRDLAILALYGCTPNVAENQPMNCASRWAKLVLVIAITSGSALPLKADQFDAVRAEIQRRLVQQSIPSVAVAVARDGHVLWEEAFGWADREDRRRATPHTPYTLGSVSKPVTATALMVLA